MRLALTLTPLAFAGLFVLAARTETWVRMGLLMVAVFWVAKWLVLWKAARMGVRAQPVRLFAWFWVYPGMDAPTFFDETKRAERPAAGEWRAAWIKLAIGVVLLWGVCRIPSNNIAAAWCGVLGLGFVLFFGLCHLSSLTLRRAGWVAPRIWDAPARSVSLGEFWGRRWNLAFRDMANVLVFRPLVPRIGAVNAQLVVFFVSGVAHEIIISVPAEAGYGLPTGYFLLQHVGRMTERTAVGRAWGLGRGLRGWFFVLLVTAGPVWMLFHAPFLERVVLPLLRAMGCL